MNLTRFLTKRSKHRRAFDRVREHRDAIAPLFDADFYRERYPDVGSSDVDPIHHYIAHGWREGRQPHPLFDSAWYLERNEDVREAGVDPVRHYVTSGWEEGRQPHILFNSVKYAEDYGIGAQSGENPLLHYLNKGWLLGFEPHLLFKTTWYLCHNPDVANANEEPLKHYLSRGWKEGRSPHPLFDPTWYLETHKDVGRSMPEPLTHYMEHGWREGRAPCEELREQLRQERGKPALRNGLTALEQLATSESFKRDREPDLFDATYYRQANDDLHAFCDQDLYRHFVTKGYAEGRIGKPIRHRRVDAQPNRPSSGTKPRPRRPITSQGRPQYSAPLIIGGFHRSGTSMTANILADAGLHVGDTLLGARPSNPYGHYEDTEIIQFHDELLRQGGQTWQTATDLPPVMSKKDWRFMVNYGSRKSIYGAWGFKDPRVCLYLPQWHATFPDLSLLYIYRPCVECIHSLRKRAARGYAENHAPQLNFNFFRVRDIATRMYVNYSKKALQFIEGFDGRVRVVALDDLLDNRDIVSEIRNEWGYQLADVLPFDVYDGTSLTLAGPNEPMYDSALLDDVNEIERRFKALLN